MIEAADNFTEWACSPERTLEQRFGVQLLIEGTRSHWLRLHDIPITFDFESDRLRNKNRALDPAYSPGYSRTETHRVEEVLPHLKQLSPTHYQDRTLRDVSFLRFCSALENLSLSQTEIPDFSPLASLTNLTRLHLWDSKCRDYRILGRLSTLEHLHLRIHTARPDLRGLERLTRLTDFLYNGNLIALQDIPRLPALRTAEIHTGQSTSLPLRSLAHLPAMPELRRLTLASTCHLGGIERCPQLLNLNLSGDYPDLSPLASLHQLTHLTLCGGDYPGLEPVSHLPELRKITLRLEFPPDFTPLTELPRLHEIALEECPVVPADLATLNAMCNPWAEEFELKPARPPARPLGPFRLRLRSDELCEKEDHTAIPRPWGDDQEMGYSETRWFYRRLNRRFTRLLGKGWGEIPESLPGGPGYIQLCISRSEDIDRLPEIIRTFRHLLATTHYPWSCLLIIDSLAQYKRGIEEIQSDPDTFDAEREREEREEYERQSREHKDFLQRKYRHQLSEESGLAPPPLPPSTPVPTPESDLAEEDEDDESEFIGQEIPDGEYDLGTKLHLYATLTEHAAYIHERDTALAEMLFEMKLEP